VVAWIVAVLLLGLVAVSARVAPDDVGTDLRLGPLAGLVGLAAVTAQAAALLLGSLSADIRLVVVAAVAPLAAAAGLGAATGVTSVAVVVAAYAVATTRPWPSPVRALALAAALVGLAELVRQVRQEGVTASTVVLALAQGLLVVGLPVAVGTVVGARREAARARVDQADALAREQSALAWSAVASERTAMARELHDIAAHHLSGIAVMTAALDRQIDTDPGGAKAAVREVRRQSTAMLRDLRSLVTMLRDDPDEASGPRSAGPTAETLGTVAALVHDARAAGRDVGLTVLGATPADLDSVGVGPLAQLAAYRTVQEALANAARHAPGASCSVEVDARPSDAVVLTVRNGPATAPTDPASATGTGFGLLGMRERAELTDAHLSAGPTPDGGWLVVLTLTRTASDDPPQEAS
jgi:signal transduction histidine kinase